MPKLLTQEQIEHYHEHGYVSPIDLMSEAEAVAIRDQLEEAEAEYPDHINGEHRNNPHLAFGFLDELAFNPTVLDAVEDLIGEDFSLWGSVLFIKEPQSPHFVSWHQDATYMGMSSNDFVTPWIALSHSNLETGCMSMLPGTHKNNIHPHDDTFGKDNILTRGQVVHGMDESKMEHLILRPGQMSLHHGEIVHGSQPNKSNERRVGFALQSYMANTITQQIGENLWLPCRGKRQVAEQTVDLQRPTATLDENAIAMRKRANDNYADILYHGAAQRRKY